MKEDFFEEDLCFLLEGPSRALQVQKKVFGLWLFQTSKAAGVLAVDRREDGL